MRNDIEKNDFLSSLGQDLELNEKNDLENESQELTERILESVDLIIKTHLKFEHKKNEGNQALIFQIDIDADVDKISETDKKSIEDYIGSSKNLKVLKITSPELAEHEFAWQLKAFSALEVLNDGERPDYANIPKPYINRTITIDDDIKHRLNSENAKIESQNASVLLSEWVNGEDLLTKLLRKYLSLRPAYKDYANSIELDFQRLLFYVNQDFQSRGIDFTDLSTHEQYKRLLQAVLRSGQEIISQQQKLQIENTIAKLHNSGIYHNDLHLRNFMIENDTGNVYIIDFGGASDGRRQLQNEIKDDYVINLLREHSLENEGSLEYRSGLIKDFERIIKLDRRYTSLLQQVKSSNPVELIKLLEIESDQWRSDTWSLKRLGAVVQSLSVDNPAVAELIKEFIKSKKNSLTIEGQEVVDSI